MQRKTSITEAKSVGPSFGSTLHATTFASDRGVSIGENETKLCLWPLQGRRS